jgi:hypothetical protein
MSPADEVEIDEIRIEFLLGIPVLLREPRGLLGDEGLSPRVAISCTNQARVDSMVTDAKLLPSELKWT